ncbi:MAG: cytochrome c oxidase assembly protein [Pseudomonadota bacterium]
MNHQARNRKLAAKLFVATLAMFGFGYALVPLYDVFCEVTGLNGKTGRLTSAEAAAMTVDESREITVEFVTNVSSDLPWQFGPVEARVVVRPGAATTVQFEAYNEAAYPIIGHAVPSVAPNTASRYFNKTECFCFTQQTLEPGERRVMPVRFVVTPDLPDHIRTLTLAYTFFEAPETAERS